MGALTTQAHGAVLVVRFAIEPGNYLTQAIMAEFTRVVTAAERDPSVRSVVLASAVPGMFIGHYDSEELLAGSRRGGLPLPVRLAGAVQRVVAGLGRIPGAGPLLDRGPTGGLRALQQFRDAVRQIRQSDLVFVAAIDGYALGAGFELALTCDLRVIGDGPYTIGLPEVTFGLIPVGGGTQILARTLGAGAAMAALLESRLFTPEEAHREGVVHYRVKQEQVVEEAIALASRLSRRVPGTVRAFKRVVYDGGSGRLGRGLAMERAEFLGLATRGPAQETVRQYATYLRDSLRAGQAPVDFYRENLPEWQERLAARHAGEPEDSGLADRDRGAGTGRDDDGTW
ncbi:enoyl-CoA hydratase/isomerase family protein [Streptomyces sp. NBC_01190]|uniref:enoyl-CoA hydratase/isomerase family protein n=1 Tax=Streptomyces sp. NBC_01190 TaxID=2903767 RepID=UPI00386D3359|nr:enoyl-CoA hydratase/isomerase family protein [Streptomyces sp. NBC_01190]